MKKVDRRFLAFLMAVLMIFETLPMGMSYVYAGDTAPIESEQEASPSEESEKETAEPGEKDPAASSGMSEEESESPAGEAPEQESVPEESIEAEKPEAPAESEDESEVPTAPEKESEAPAIAEEETESEGEQESAVLPEESEEEELEAVIPEEGSEESGEILFVPVPEPVENLVLLPEGAAGSVSSSPAISEDQPDAEPEIEEDLEEDLEDVDPFEGLTPEELTEMFQAMAFPGIMMMTEMPAHIIRLKLNGSEITSAASVNIGYGTALNFTLWDNAADVTSTAKFQIYNAKEIIKGSSPTGKSWKNISNGSRCIKPIFEIGESYYINYIYKISDGMSVTTFNDYTTKNAFNGSYVINVVKGTLDAPESPVWDGSVMRWSAVTTASDGFSAPDLVDHYEVKLYKDGALIKDTTYNTDTTNYDNIANNILDEAGFKEGSYTFEVSAVIAENDYYVTRSAVSARSSAYIAAKAVVEGDSGIKNVSPAESVILLPGNSSNNKINPIAAVVKDGYVFDEWTASGDASFGDASATSTSVTIADDYAGSSTLKITATTRDLVYPTIAAFSASNGKLVGSASDNDGIVAWAITTGSIDWTDISSVNSGEWKFEPNAAGTYYFYVKDRSDNVVRAANGIKVTEVTLVDYYKNSVLQSDEAAKVYVLGGVNPDFHFPETKRAGYNFAGWFSDSSCNDSNRVTESAVASHGAYTFYAKWEEQDIEAVFNIASYSAIYDGTVHKISSGALGVSGRLSYTWEKASGAAWIDSGSASYLPVRNVADSGDYKVTLTMKDAGGATLSTVTRSFTVDITAADLLISANNMSVDYGAAVPEYALTYTTLLGTDKESVVSGGSIYCSYTPGNAPGSYPITIGGFTADNYNITTADGTLTVNEKLAANLSVVFTETGTSTAAFTYTGNPIEPELTVKDNGTDLVLGRDYTVAYDHNTSAGPAASVTVTFKGNYTGTTTLYFTIGRAPVSGGAIVAENWTYRYPHASATVGVELDSRATFYYAVSGASISDPSAWFTDEPVHAGDYQVYAVIAETNDFDELVTSPVSFTIAKRHLIIGAANAEFIYDGVPHSAPGFRYGEGSDSFAAGEGFKKIECTGSITNVDDSPVVNRITTTELNNVTSAGDYDVTITNGSLTMHPVELPIPATIEWDEHKGGNAKWVAVSKKELEVSYEVYLYSYDGESYTTVGGVHNIANGVPTMLDLKSDIETNIASAFSSGSALSYAFSVKAIPSGGANQHNYKASSTSAITGNLHGANVEVKAAPGSETSIGTLTINGKSTEVMFDGDEAALIAMAEVGYYFSDIVWKVSPSGIGVNVETISTTEKKCTATAKIKLADSMPLITIYAKVDNEVPVITTFEAVNAVDFSEVTFNIGAQDTLDLDAWALVKGSTTPEALSTEWTSFGSNTTGIASTSKTAVDTGEYYLFVRDAAGNVVCSDYSLSIYSLTLQSGEAAEVTPAAVMVKAQNTAIPLPAVAAHYEKPGYDFLKWEGAAGSYPDKGKYDANASTTLTAIWAPQTFEYTVEYYRMDTDGTYPETPDMSKHYSTLMDTTVTPDAAEVPFGFTLNVASSPAVTITGAGIVQKIYYDRNRYVITYKYSDPVIGVPTPEEYVYYYGQEVPDKSLPTRSGYDFVGWNYSTNGHKPETMPASNVTATGYFKARETVYHIRYFFQDLIQPGSTAVSDVYSLDSVRNIDENALQGQTVTMNAFNMPEVKGFRFDGFNVTKGTQGALSLPGSLNTTSASAIVDEADQVYINCYFTRETYKVTLNVWNGIVGSGSARYTKTWDVPYGVKLADPETYTTLEPTWETPDGTVLADYIGWSTGDAPEYMPAGNVTITRQYVSTTEREYTVKVSFENAEHAYVASDYKFYAPEGTLITITDHEDSNPYSINYNDFLVGKTRTVKGVVYDAYRYETELGTVTSGAVIDPSKGSQLTLRIYFKRNEYPVKIDYYYVADGSSDKVLFATATKSGIWGSKYDVEAFAYFDTTPGGVWKETVTSEVKDGVTVKGTRPDLYDFRNNFYVISYNCYYNADQNNWYGTRHRTEYDDSKYVTAKVEETFGMGPDSSLEVYYTYVKPEPTDLFYVDLKYRPYKGDSNGSQDVHIVATGAAAAAASVAGFDVRIADEAYFYEKTISPGSIYESYPGLSRLISAKNLPPECKVKYNYVKLDENLVDGFTRVSASSITSEPKSDYYYINASERAIYIPRMIESNGIKLENGLIQKVYTRAKYFDSEIGNEFIQEYVDAYNATAEAASQAAIKVYDYSRTWYGITYDSSIEHVITFESKRLYTVTYRMNGKSCNIDAHKYYEGYTLPLSAIGCNHEGKFPERPGYVIQWYQDPDCKVAIPAGGLPINDHKTLYGQYVPAPHVLSKYAYYELADYAIGASGSAVKYITEDNVAEFSDKIAVTSDSAFVSGSAVTIYTYTYTPEGAAAGYVVMKQVDSITRSFTTVDMDIKSADYVMSGYHYAEEEAGNNVTGYCQLTDIALRAHYARDVYTLTRDNNYPAASGLNNSPQNTQYRYGQTVSLAEPVVPGYVFEGWNVTSGSSLWATYSAVSKLEFAMPAGNITAKASWSLMNYTQDITHYYINTDGMYEIGCMYRATESAVTITVEGSDKLGYSLTGGGVVVYDYKSGQDWYFAAKERGGSYSVSESDVIAVVQHVSAKQDHVVPVNTIDISGFSFVRGSQLHKGISTALTSSSSITLSFGDEITYYYDRTGYTLDLQAFSTTGIMFNHASNPALSLVGDGFYPHGRSVRINANVPKGYTFIGWFNAEDVASGTSLKPGYASASAIATTAVTYVTVDDNTTLAAVLKPTEVDIPTLTISGITQLTHGYKESPENALTIKATFPAGSSSYIKSYQWYVDNGTTVTAIEDADSPTYIIPSGMPAGNYEFFCKVTVGRLDNELEDIVYTPRFSVSIGSEEMVIEIVDFKGYFDGKEHSFEILVSEEFKDGLRIYYSTSGALDASNYEAEGTELIYTSMGAVTNPVFVDVNYEKDASGAAILNASGDAIRIPHTVYLYAHTENSNYIDVTSSAIVDIKAKEITLNAGTKKYAKIYDGETVISGFVADEDSDLGKLARDPDLYEINGLIAGDTTTYIIDCDAEFNTRHRLTAKNVRISNIKLGMDASGSAISHNYNYIFDPSYTIDISGYIQPLDLEIAWVGDSSVSSEPAVVFTGSQVAPMPTFASPSAVPAVDRPNITLSAIKDGIYVGRHSATLKVNISGDGDTDVNDFTFSPENTSYQIIKRPLTLVPVGTKVVTYDGQEHALEFSIIGATGGSVSEGSIPAGHVVTAETSKTDNVYASSYAISIVNVGIKDASGNNIISNYEVTCPAVTLKIKPRPVQLTWSAVSIDKDYDGTNKAVIENIHYKLTSVDGITESGIVSPDAVNLASYSAVYSGTVSSGSAYTVTITDAALDNSNYVLNNTDFTAEGKISGGRITVTAEPKEVTYGTASFTDYSVTYSGLQNGETIDRIGSRASISYKLSTALTGAALFDYTPTLAAATYYIIPSIGGLTADNYDFEWDSSNAAQTLTVKPRPIAVAATSRAAISKVYDGTTTTAAIESAYYEFTSVAGIAESGIANAEVLGITFDSAYDSKNVAADNPIHLTGLVLTGSTAANYELTTSAIDIAGAITQAELTVTAENENTVYGSAAPKFAIKYSGFKTDDTKDNSVSESGLSFVCRYTTAGGVYSNVGTYTITPGGLTSGNYSITYVPGTLTVTKAALTVQALLGGRTTATAIYSRDGIPAFSYAISGFKYTADTEDSCVTAKAIGSPLVSYIHTVTTASATVGGITKEVVSSVAGDYDVKPDVTNMQADNYYFVPAKAVLTINRFPLKITGVQIRDKYYDGTDKFSREQVDINGVTYDGLLSADKAWIASHSSIAFDVTGTYASIDAGTHSISLAITAGDYLKSRCYVEADGTQTSAAGIILQRPILITADDKTVVYGSALPALTYKTSKPSGAAIGDLVSGETVETLDYVHVYSTAPGSCTETGTYDIMPSNAAMKAPALTSNYAISYKKGTLTVTKASLSAPSSVTWGTCGSISWTSVAGIGDVAVDYYKAELYRDGVLVETATTAGLSADFNAWVHATAGAYTVKVYAIASETNNAGNMNVLDSAAKESGKLFAANVTVGFASDDKTTMGKGPDPNTTIGGIDGSIGRVMVNGDTLDFSAGLDPTRIKGFVVKNVTASSGLSISKKADNMSSGASILFESTVTMTANPANADPQNVTVQLGVREATLVLDASLTPSAVEFGYFTNPVMTVTATALSSDTVTSGAYTYEYVWTAYAATELFDTTTTALSASNTDSYEFPLGKLANEDNKEYYWIQCEVTATRNDNGETITDTIFRTLHIKRATLLVNVTQAGWTYGEARTSANVTYTPTIAALDAQIPDKTVVTYKTSDGSINYGKAVPTNAGVYRVFVTVSKTDNYGEASNSYTFTIDKAKLATPTGVTMNSDPGKSSYGIVSWTTVAGINENNGENSASKITPTYQVVIYNPNGTITTCAAVSGGSLNIREKIQQPGTYKVGVIALSDNTANCDHSDESIQLEFNVGSAIAITGTPEKVYDGSTVILDATTTGATSYEWFRNGDPMGVTTASISVVNVSDSALYDCQVMIGGDSYYTPYVKVDITKRTVDFTSWSDTKIYDGTALTNSGITVGGLGLATGSGIAETVVYNFTGSQTAVGSTANAFTVSWTGTADEANYTDKKTSFGELTVTPRPVTNAAITVAAIADLTYNGYDQKPAPVVTYDSTELDRVVTLGALDYDVAYPADTRNVGTKTITITGKGNYSGTVTIDYNIVPRGLTVTTASVTKEYDGTPLTSTGQSITGLATSDAISLDITGTQTLVGQSDNVFTINWGYTLPSNYNLATAAGILEVTDRTTPFALSLKADDLTVTYDGVSHSVSTIGTISVDGGEDQAQANGLLSVTIGGVEFNIANISALASGTAVGTYGSIFTATSAAVVLDAGGNNVTSQFAISCVPGMLTIKENNTEIVIKTESHTFTYDGLKHDLTVTYSALPAGYHYDVLPQTTVGATHVSESDIMADVTDINIVIKNAQDEVVYSITGGSIGVRRLNVTFVTSGAIIINKAPLSVVTESDSKVYDGTPLTAGGIITGFAAPGGVTESAVLNLPASQTGVGTTKNAFTITWDHAAANDYTVSSTVGSLTVSEMSITDAAVSYSVLADTIYNGTEQKHYPTITYAGMTLAEGTDYDIAFTDATNATTVAVTITGKGNYTGTKVMNYVIAPKSLGTGAAYNIGISVDAIPAFTYNQESQTPASITVKDTVSGAAVTLAAVTNYTVSYSADTTNATTVAVTITGKGNYKGSIETTYVINRKSLNNGAGGYNTGITVAAIEDITYDGSEHHPAPTVKDLQNKETTLESGSAYTVSYPSSTAVGTYTATISGIGNYKDDITFQYRIVDYKEPITITVIGANYIYDGYKHDLTVTSSALPTGYAFSVLPYTTVGATHVAEGEVRANASDITFKILNAASEDKTAALNYNFVTSAAVKINTRPITLWTDSANKIYDGTPLTTGGSISNIATEDALQIKPNVTGTITSVGAVTNSAVVDWGTAASTDYAVTEDFGTLTITAKSLSNGAGGYNTGISVGAISPFIYNQVSQTPASIAVQDTVSGAAVGLVAGRDYTVGYSSDTTNATTVAVTITGTGNYKDSITTTYEIVQKSVGHGSAYGTGITIAAIADITYDGSEHHPAPVVKDLQNKETILVSGSAYTVSYPSSTAVGTYIATISGINNYKDAITFQYNIVENTLPVTVKTEGGEYTYDGNKHFATVTVSGLQTGYSLVYASSSAFAQHVSDGVVKATESSISFAIQNAQGVVVHEVINDVVQPDKDKLNITYVTTGAVSITAAALNVYTYSASKPFDRTPLTTGGSIVGLVTTDAAIANLNVTGTITTVGAVTNSAVISWGAVQDTDYKVTYHLGTLTITGRDIAEAAISDLANTTYSGSSQVHKPVATYAGIKLVEGTDYTLAFSDTTNAGIVTVTISGIGNFSGTTTAAYTINKAPLSVTTGGLTAEYDGKDHKTTAQSIIGLVHGETITLNITGKQNLVGQSDNVFTITWDTANPANYQLTTAAGILKVTDRTSPFPVTVTSNGISYVYNGTAQSVSGLTGTSVEIDGVHWTISGLSAGVSRTDVGTSAAVFAGTAVVKDSAGHDVTSQFAISYVEGVLEITPRSLGNGASYTSGVAVEPMADIVYDGSVKNPAPVVKDSVSGSEVTLASGSAYTVTYPVSKEVGTYIATISGIGNYKDDITFQYNIVNNASITISAIGSDNTYDGTKHYMGVTSTALAAGYSFSAVPSTSVGATHVSESGIKALATDINVTVVNAEGVEVYKVAGGAVVTTTAGFTVNYDLAAEVKVTRAALTVKTYSGSKTYDGTPLTAGGIITGFAAPGGVTESAVLNLPASQTEVGTTKNAFTITWDHAAENDYKIIETVGTLEVTGKAITDSDVFVSMGSVTTYNGTEQKLPVAITSSAVTPNALVLGTDYTVEYSPATDAGIVTVTISGIGNFTGTVVKTYEIEAKSLGTGAVYNTGVSVGAIADFTYNQASQTPASIVVKDTVSGSAVDLTAGTDYTVIYSADTINATTVAVTITGKGNYTGSITTTYNINKKSIAASTVTVAAIGDVVYDGTSHKELPVVTDSENGSQTLASGSAYTVTYPADTTNVGTVTVTISGIGNYKDSINVSYNIVNSANVTISAIASTPSYDGSKHILELSCTALPAGYNYAAAPATSIGATHVSEGAVRATMEDIDVVVMNAKGDIVYAVTGGAVRTTSAGLNVHYDLTAAVTVAKAALGITVADAQKEYDGTSLTSTAHAITGLKNDETIKLNFTGSQTIVGSTTNAFSIDWVTAAESDYDLTTTNGTLTVTNAAVKYVTTVSAISRTTTYSGVEQGVSGLTGKTFTLNGKSFTISGLSAAVSGTAVATYASIVSGTAIVTDALGNDVTAQFDVQRVNGVLAIEPKTLGTGASYNAGVSVGAIAALTYTGVNNTPAGITVTDEVDGTPQPLVAGTDYTVSYSEDTINAGTVTVTITGKGNYSGSITTTYTIEKAPLGIVIADASKVYDGKPITSTASTITGLKNGEKIQLNFTGSQTLVGSTTNAFTIGWSPAGGATAKEGNYDVTITNGSLTITDRPDADKFKVTVTSAGLTAGFDGGSHSVSGIEGLSFSIDGVDFTIEGITAGAVLTEVGTAAAVFSGTPVIKDAAGNDVTSQFKPLNYVTGQLEITAKSLGSGASYAAGITVDDIQAMDYNGNGTPGSGEGCKPLPVIKDSSLVSGQKTLVKDVDYTVSYENITAVGTATVVITGIGNYTGTIRKTFTIDTLVVTEEYVTEGSIYGGVTLKVESVSDAALKVTAKVKNELEVINAVLDLEEKWRLMNTADHVELRLTIQRVTGGSIDLDEKAIVEQFLASNAAFKLADYMDIKLDKSWDGGANWINIPETAVDVQVIIDIPDDLYAGGRTYHVYRVHGTTVGGITTYSAVLLADLDGKGNKTFETNTKYFSTYALLYTVDPLPPGGGGGGGEVPPEELPPETPTGGGIDTGVSDMLNTDDHIAYIAGYPDGSVGAQKSITRAEVAAMFYSLLRDKTAGKANFADIDGTEWYAKAVGALASRNLVSGYPDGTFRPNNKITRAEFTTICVQFSKVKEGNYSFPDVAPNYWAKPFIDISVFNQWCMGYTDGTFRPENYITRAEAATIINNMLGREPDVNYIESHYSKIKHFTDLTDHKLWYFYEICEAANAHGYTRPESEAEKWTGLN